MPAIGNISVIDAQAFPEAHVFAPVTTDGTKARLANRNGSTPKGFETLEVEVVQPASNNGAYRVLLRGSDPVEATVDGTVVVDRVSSFDIRLNFSQKSTSAERKDLLKIVSNLLAHATIVTCCENLEPIY